MKYKNMVYLFLATVLSVSVLFFSLLFIYDPLQLFHKRWFGKDTYIWNMRQQAVAIIDHQQYDSVILGTSMLVNTSSREASRVLGGKFINISMPGSDFYERFIVLEYLLRSRPIKKILYSLDSEPLLKTTMGNSAYPVETFDYLYDSCKINDFKAYVNERYIKCLLTFSSDAVCMGTIEDIDRPNAWYKREKHRKKFGGLHHWFDVPNSKKAINGYQQIVDLAYHVRSGKSQSIANVEEDISKSERYLDRYILSFVEKYPNTDFILIFPPYSRLAYAMQAQCEKKEFMIYTAMVKYLVDKSSTYSNLEVFAWGNEPFADDLVNYKDAFHYHHRFNSWMLGAIAGNKGLLTSSNVDKYLDEFTEKALKYDLVGVGRKVDNYLKERQH